MVEKPLIRDPPVPFAGQGYCSQNPKEENEGIENVNAKKERGAAQKENAETQEKAPPEDEGGQGPVSAVPEDPQAEDKKNGGRESAPRRV
jgi:hypothetical protein